MADHEINIVVKGKNQTGNLFGSVTSGITALNQALEIARKVAEALKKAYDTAKEGAELEYAAGKFDNLAKSIGTVSNALLGDLRKATDGMVSDSELMASAGDFMALGLAKTHEEVVRLATVSGALGMNMNQLVLTLTNQTTMRFDALGVSVDGFDEKVKQLEATGMSASDAFNEAFLQQAEEQIERVGYVSDTSLGAFKRLEAQVKNLGDAGKKHIANALTPAVEDMADAVEKAANRVNVLTRAQELGISTTKTVTTSLYGVQEQTVVLNKTTAELVAELVLYDATIDQSAEDTIAYYIALAQAGEGAEEFTEAQKKLKQALDDVTSLESNYKGIIDLAYNYSDILEEMAENEEEIARLRAEGTAEALEQVDDLIGKNDELKQSMADLANQIALDMFEATIAVGGVTEAELSAYMQMAIDMGLMSEEGAQAAMTAYNNAISEINSYKIDDKTGNLLLDATQAYEAIRLYELINIADKNANINLFLKYHGTTPQWGYDPYEFGMNPGGGGAAGKVVSGLAAGGIPAFPVGEIGPELFFPAQNGRVVSNSEAKASLRSGRGGGETIVVNISTPMNFADKAWVERELAPYITKAIRSERIRG